MVLQYKGYKRIGEFGCNQTTQNHTSMSQSFSWHVGWICLGNRIPVFFDGKRHFTHGRRYSTIGYHTEAELVDMLLAYGAENCNGRVFGVFVGGMKSDEAYSQPLCTPAFEVNRQGFLSNRFPVSQTICMDSAHQGDFATTGTSDPKF